MSRSLSDLELGWVAGLLEGEGSFTFGSLGNRTRATKIRQLQITCGMTDEDTIDRLHATVGIGSVYKERRRDPRRAESKQMYIWHASKRADVVPLLEALLPQMSERRSERIAEMLQYAKDNPLRYETEPEHGTRKRYRNKGCRCTPCVEANRTYARERAREHRRKKREEAQDQAA